MSPLDPLGLPAISLLAWSPDSNFVAVGGMSGGLFVLSKDFKEMRMIQRGIYETRAIAWNPDSTKLVTSHTERAWNEGIAYSQIIVQVWDPVSALAIMQLDFDLNDLVTAVAWSNDGTRIAGTKSDSSLIVWDAETGEILSTSQWKGNYAYEVHWTPDDRLIITADYDSIIRVWENNQEKISFDFSDVGNATHLLELTSRKDLLLFPLDDHTLGVRRLTSEEYLFSIPLEWEAYFARLSSSGKYIAGALNSRNLYIWNGTDGAVVTTLTTKEMITAFEWDPLEEIIACGTNDGKILVRTIGQVNTKTYVVSKYSIRRLAWSPDGRYLIVRDAQGGIAVWVRLGSKLEETYSNTENTLGGLLAMAGNSTFDLLIQGYEQGYLVLRAGENSSDHVIGNGNIVALDWSPNTDYVLCGMDNGSIYLLKTLEWSPRLLVDTKSKIESLSWSKDGEKILCTTILPTSALVFIADGLILWESHDDALHLVWDKEGTQLIRVIRNDETWQQIFTLESLEAVIGTYSFPESFAEISTAAWSFSGLVAFGDNEGHLSIWNTITRQFIRTFFNDETPIVRLEWHPSEPLIACGIANNTVRMWNENSAESSKPIYTSSTITDIKWSVDGTQLAIASVDGVVQVLKVT